MTTLYLAMEDALVALRGDRNRWVAEEHLAGQSVSCVAADPTRPERVYAGTDDEGVWRTADGGRTWTPAGPGIAHRHITALAAGPGADGRSVVYAGTEPSALFVSGDGGETWRPLDGLGRLPSAKTWSFPPRPETHHVRWIAVDPHDPARLYVAIEAGALIRSLDGGRTWLDRVPSGPYDTHTLALHPREVARVYSAAGDGFFESRDGGETWASPEEGLRHLYLFGVVADPNDPDTVVVSGASGPGRAYHPPRAEAHVYVRRGAGPWREVRDGLPEPRGTTVSVLAAALGEPTVIYAANNRGIFRSTAPAERWERLEIPWPARFEDQAAQGLVVAA